MTIPAKYEHGVFTPLEPIELKDGTLVEIVVRRDEDAKPLSVRELGFTGMWSDREDMADAVSYVDRLRDNPRG